LLKYGETSKQKGKKRILKILLVEAKRRSRPSGPKRSGDPDSRGRSEAKIHPPLEVPAIGASEIFTPLCPVKFMTMKSEAYFTGVGPQIVLGVNPERRLTGVNNVAKNT